jgi:hypothetical protein
VCGNASVKLGDRGFFTTKNTNGHEKNSWEIRRTLVRKTVEKATGRIFEEELIKANHARVMYDPAFIPEDKRVINKKPDS